MSVMKPKSLNEDEVKSVVKTAFKLFWRVLPASLSVLCLVSILTYLVAVFLFPQGAYSEILLALVLFFIMPSILFTVHKAAEGESIGPESVFMNIGKCFRNSTYCKLDLLATFGYIILIVILCSEPEFKAIRARDVGSMHWFHSYFTLVGGFLPLVFLMEILVRRFDLLRVLIYKNKMSFEECANLEDLGSCKNSNFIKTVDFIFILFSFLLSIVSFYFSEFGWFFLPVSVLIICFQIALFRAIFEGKDGLTQVVEEEISSELPVVE